MVQGAGAYVWLQAVRPQHRHLVRGVCAGGDDSPGTDMGGELRYSPVEVGLEIFTTLPTLLHNYSLLFFFSSDSKNVTVEYFSV
jgi:hypothetical protein